MRSITWGQLTMEETVDKIIKYINTAYKHQEIEITIGTDSQQFSDTKVVAVIVVRIVGSGGIFFYDVTRMRKMNSIREKIYKETEISLELADTLIKTMQDKGYMGEDLVDNKVYLIGKEVSLSIHVDAGYNGPTNKVITEITGWIKACGYGVEVKPNSYAASTVADRISK